MVATRLLVALSLGASGAEENGSFTAIKTFLDTQNVTWFSQVPKRFSTLAEAQALCGTDLPADPSFDEPMAQLAKKSRDIPESFDARDAWPGCAYVIGNVRDQSDCGSCWAFAATETFNDRHCIATGQTTLFSVQDTTANCNKNQGCNCAGCNGGDLENPWIWFSLVGVVTGGDFGDRGNGTTCAPYSLQPCAHHVPATATYPECPSKKYPTPATFNQCLERSYPKSYKEDKIRAASFPYVPIGVEAIQKDILENGPVSAAFKVYSDFPTYKSGVYKHATTEVLGGHGVKIIGWGVQDEQDYWLVVNSWNEEWGDHGLFKIARGINEGGIEKGVTVGKSAGAQPDVALV